MTTEQILAIQDQAVQTSDRQLLHLAWMALGYDNRCAFMPALPADRQRACDRLAAGTPPR